MQNIKLKNIRLNIANMNCNNCAKNIEKNALKLDGIIKAKVSYASSSGEFEVRDLKSLQRLKEKIKEIGFEVSNDFDEHEFFKMEYLKKLKNKFIFAALSSFFLIISEILNLNTRFISLIVILAVFLYSARDFFTHAFYGIKSKNLDMNVLVALGTTSALIYSSAVIFFPQFFPENLKHIYLSGSAMIITFILIGKFLEEKSKMKAGEGIKELMNLSPKFATIITENGQNIQIKASELKKGDMVIVKSGYNIPCDGEIIQGGAEIDTSAITGESLSQYKNVGDNVFAGSTNINGHIIIKATKATKDSLISQIVDILNKAGDKKMSISKLADKITNIFVPIVLFLSLISLITWILIGENINHALICAISVLIISCPCALGLATPIAIINSLSSAAKNGILIKNPNAIELVSKIKFVVFDKTGTLSKGKIVVQECSLNDEDLLLAVNLEKLSGHHISKAIVDFGIKKNLELKEVQVDNFENFSGLGLKGTIQGKEIIIGSKKLLKQENINFNEETGDIFCAINKEFKGYFCISDTLRDEANSVINELKKMGLKIIIASGDNENAVKTLGKNAGIEEFYANMLPTDKYELIKKLQKEAGVMFVGDGANDALALRQADIGIAMNIGSDIAKGAGDILLIKDELSSINKFIKISKFSMLIIKQNLFWAFIYNLICIPIAAGLLYPVFGILLSPVYGAIAMCFSSLNVVLNSLRIKARRNY